MSQRTVEQLEVLRQFATIRQIEYIDAIISEGSIRAAARKLEVYDTTIGQSISSLERKYESMSGENPRMLPIIPDGLKLKGNSTYINKDGKMAGQWVKTNVDHARTEELLKEFVETLSKNIKGLHEPIDKPSYGLDDLFCVYPMGDPHFGMYAWALDAGDNFDLKIAEELTCNAVDRLVATAPMAKTALLLNLGDMYHADNQDNTSKSGHQLDVDGRWTKIQQVGLRAMIYCIDRLLQKHEKVIFRINGGNHDNHSAKGLALMLSCYYSREPRLEVDLSPSVIWYYHFGEVLIGSTHGDTIKGKDFLSIMASDVPKMWGNSKHRYGYIGHVHHHDSKEYQGGIVEYFRTLAARDAWHQGQGYRAGRDMRLIVLHKEYGEIERHTCDIGMII